MQLRPFLLAIVASAAAGSVQAQNVTPGLAKIGNIFEGLFKGIFDAFKFRPEIWMKLILVIISFTILYAVFKSVWKKDDKAVLTKGANIVLSLAIAIAMVAPLSDAFMKALFGALGFTGLIFYIAPIVGLIYLTYKLTHPTKDDDTPEEAKPHHYIIALVLWVIALVAYIAGIGSQVGIEYIDTAQGMLSLVAIGFIIYYIFKLVTSFGESTPASEAAPAPDEPAPTPHGAAPTAPAVHHPTIVGPAPARRAPTAASPDSMRDYLTLRDKNALLKLLDSAERSLGRLMVDIHDITWPRLLAHERTIRAELGALAGDLLALKAEKRRLAKFIAPRILEALIDDTETTITQTNHWASPSESNFHTVEEAEHARWLRDLHAWYGQRGNAHRLLLKYRLELRRR